MGSPVYFKIWRTYHRHLRVQVPEKWRLGLTIGLAIFGFLNTGLCQSSADTARINALYIRAHRIHEDSAVVAEQLCQEILRASIAMQYPKGIGDANLTLGAIRRNEGKLKESYQFFYRALQIRRALADSNRVAAVFTNLGINMLDESKYDSAIATVLYAIKISESSTPPDYSLLGSEFLLLSNICDEYKEAEDALKYARLSLNSFQKTGNIELVGKAAYAMANRFYKNELPDSALYYYDQAYICFTASPLNLYYLGDILVNKGLIYAEKGDFILAGQYFSSAETILKKIGATADYFHLYLNKGYWYVLQKKWRSGIQCFLMAMPADYSDMNYLDQLFLFENLSDAYASMEVNDSAFYYQKLAYDIRDSIYNDNKQKDFVRFQTERYKRETAQQGLEAQKQASKARLLLQTSALLLLLALAVLYAYFQRKRSFFLIQKQKEQLHQQEIDELIQQSELKYLRAGLEGRETERSTISRELHDQLGSTIVTLSWQYDAILENTNPGSPNYSLLEKLNKSLQHLYNDVRRLSHQMGSGVLERAGLIPVLKELLSDISTHQKMEVSFSAYGMENRLEIAREVNILRIMQELISNILKYANATELSLQINHIDHNVNIILEDNGLGFTPNSLLQPTGMGLSNIETRLRSVNGTIQFEKRPAGGTTVIINIPV